jgi:hypothetical protein
MKLRTKWIGMVGLGIAWGFVGQAQAINPDTMVVSVTPGGVTYSVSIASPMAQGYVFGTVNLNATTISTVAIVVTNNGNVSEYFALKISNTSPDNWAPTAGAPTTNNFRMMAHFASGQPADGTFADALDGTIPDPSDTLYGQASTKTTASGSKNLWLRLSMPQFISGSGGAQTMTLTVNGQGT